MAGPQRLLGAFFIDGMTGETWPLMTQNPDSKRIQTSPF